jgi:hypothetical protein
MTHEIIFYIDNYFRYHFVSIDTLPTGRILLAWDDTDGKSHWEFLYTLGL